MKSIYDELMEKLNRDPRLTKRGGPRADLGLLLFNHRESLKDLWLAASGVVKSPGTPADLAEAVERLRPIFGDRQP